MAWTRRNFHRLWIKLERAFFYYAIRLFRIRDNSEKVSRGFALGLLVNFFPTFGFGVVISGFFARLLGGNALAGFVGGATLTFAWPFLFYLNMVTGGWLEGRMTVRDPSEITESRMQSLVWGKTFTIGALTNSLLAGAVVYVLLLGLFKHYRAVVLMGLHRAMKRHQRRALAVLKPRLSMLHAKGPA